MKKILALMTILIMGLAFTACGSGQAEQSEQADVQAPYLGYAPLTEDTNAMIEVFESSYGYSPTLALLQYDAGDDNVAIVRMEEASEDGTWKTVEEQRLLLIDNANAGYMVFKGDGMDGVNGVSVNTALIENPDTDTLAHNSVELKPLESADSEEFNYSTSAMFGSNDVEGLSEEELLAKEDRMDMTSKKVLQISFEENTILESNGTVYGPFDEDIPDDVIESDVNDIYANPDGKFDKAYKEQKMAAVTIEFLQDEKVANAPCVWADGDNISYESAGYDGGLISLEKSTKDGGWETVGEESYIIFHGNTSSGTFEIEGSLSEGEITIGTADFIMSDGTPFENKATFTLDDSNIKSEMFGVKTDDGLVKATKKVILNIASTGELPDAPAKDIYKNKDGKYDDAYKDTMYVVTFRFAE